MQSGRVVQLHLDAETEGVEPHVQPVAPMAHGLAAKIQRALERRAARAHRRFLADIADRDERGRFR